MDTPLLRGDKEAAAFSRVSKRTIIGYRQRGIVPFRQIGHVIWYDKNELLAAYNRFRVGAVGEPKLPRVGAGIAGRVS